MVNNQHKQLSFAVLEYLRECQADGTVSSDNQESLDVAIQCIGEAFGVDLDNEDQQRELSIKPTKLSDIFSVFVRTQQRRKASEATAAADVNITATTAEEEAPELSAEDTQRAEELKAQGNQKMTARDFSEAIRFYSEAIAINGRNAVYYANRAAAHSQAGDHESAVKDALKAGQVQPNYSKAYSRLGHAYFNLEKYSEAVDAYEKAVELDPNNTAVRTSLDTCRRKLSGTDSPTVTSPPPSSTATADRGMPDLSSLAGAGPGGMPDIGSLLSNPAMRQMASQMMQNPDMMRMAQQMMGGAGGGGGGSGGGMPDISAMMNDPNLRNLAQQFMGGSGGGSGNAGGNAGGR